ncbi:hypothetical protein HWC69_gp098 [Gordonia phage Ranch]|uniref:Uncharacterized protein n=1 Tax=Gordonia phage Ranch TaxID=2599848 RepID=A0A5J6TNK5_9CAUD|nr:hypothetical protein HWC69_gp098 [Gordonia phage Ranch]QFG12400.1 hypothetical protein PBI_RANCH_98 [Gordonia phage Ranch]
MKEMERMDANPNASQVLAAKAAIEQARVTKQTEKALSMFADAESVEQVCRYLAGFASVAWSKPPTGEFDPDTANMAAYLAEKRLEEIIRDRISEVINGQLADMLEQAQAKINAFPDIDADPYAFFKPGMKVRLTESEIVGRVLTKDEEQPHLVRVDWDNVHNPSDEVGLYRGRDLVIISEGNDGDH